MLTAFVNSKGGVGKSTLAVHFAVWLYDRGAKVGLIDCDKQCSSSAWIAEAEPRISVETAATPEELALKARALAQSCDFVVGDGPAGLDEMSRTLLILADLAIFPIGPSILDLRSVAGAVALLKFAQTINGGLPEGKLVLNKTRLRDRISRELEATAPTLSLRVAGVSVRELQAFRECIQQGTVVTRMENCAVDAANDVIQLFEELTAHLNQSPLKASNS